MAKARSRTSLSWADRAKALPGARRAALKLEPFEGQLCRLVPTAPTGDDWLHEAKLDGYRILSARVKTKTALWSRNALDWTKKAPELAEALSALDVSSVALDGEIIVGKGTKEDFNALQRVLSEKRTSALTYVVFDLLHLDGYDLRGVPLIERKALLEELLAAAGPPLMYSEHAVGNGPKVFAAAERGKLEGIISKRVDSLYVGGRTDDWRKVKTVESDEFAVVGFNPSRKRDGFSSLALARMTPEGWTYAGKVGSGFNNDELLDIQKRLGPGSSTPTVSIPDAVLPELKGVRWVEPAFVVEVFLRGISSAGVLRQPSLKSLRLDKDPLDLADSDRAAPPTRSTAAKRPGKKGGARKKAATPERAHAASVSSPDKVLYPEDGYTKQQVSDYYAAVMKHLLPEIIGRPLSLIRCPNGTGKPCFFQKHHTPGLKHVDLVPLKEEGGHNARYLVVRDAAGVQELVQNNTLEFHPWGSTAESPDTANRVVFDLDPGPGVPWEEIKAAAVKIRKLLKDLDLESFLRTSGGKGLHVVVPLEPGCDWHLVKRFAKGFADALAVSDSGRFVSVSTLAKRPGKIFVDYLRNGRGATAVASYSLRGRPGAPVAFPIAWSALGKLESPAAFTMENVPAMLKRRKDPWKGIGEIKQNLERWSWD